MKQCEEKSVKAKINIHILGVVIGAIAVTTSAGLLSAPVNAGDFPLRSDCVDKMTDLVTGTFTTTRDSIKSMNPNYDATWDTTLSTVKDAFTSELAHECRDGKTLAEFAKEGTSTCDRRCLFEGSHLKDNGKKFCNTLCALFKQSVSAFYQGSLDSDKGCVKKIASVREQIDNQNAQAAAPGAKSALEQIGSFTRALEDSMSEQFSAKGK